MCPGLSFWALVSCKLGLLLYINLGIARRVSCLVGVVKGLILLVRDTPLWVLDILGACSGSSKCMCCVS